MLKHFSFIHKIEYTSGDGFLILSVDNARYHLPIILKQVDTESVALDYKVDITNNFYIVTKQSLVHLKEVIPMIFS